MRRKTNRKLQKLSSMYPMANNLPSVASLFKVFNSINVFKLQCMRDHIASKWPPAMDTVMATITKTCLFKYTENFTTKKNENFQIKKKSDFFVFLLKT